MKILIFLCVILIITISIFSFVNSHLPIRVFRTTGEVPLGATKIFADTIRATSSSGFVIDISAAGFSTIPRVQITPMRNTGTVTEIPNIAIKSITLTSITINIQEGNSNTITILGIQVLSGSPTIFSPNPTAILLNVQAVGS